MNIEEARSKLISFIDFYNKKPKEENRKFKMLQVDNIDIKAIETLLTAYEKEKEKNNNAYRKANNYLYFNDSADYEVALWGVIRTLRPDLAEKWDNGEDAILEYIEEE